MAKSEGVPGYRMISDEVIRTIVKGKSSLTTKADDSGAECDQYFPLGDQHKTDFVAGVHPDAVYRSGDGSDELYRGLLPVRCCMR
jgi:hypothetical protein